MGDTERDTDTDTDFIVKATDPYTIAFLCLQSHSIVEGKKQAYSMNHTFTRAVFL